MVAMSSLQPLAQAREPSSLLRVPGFFLVSHDPSILVPVEGVASDIYSPKDDGIEPVPGDDLLAPNAVTASRLNRVVVDASANVGYSKSAQDTRLAPSAICYDAVLQDGPNGGFAMTLKLTMEYASTFPAEGMVVWLKKKQQVLNDEDGAPELLLIETSFEDFVDGKWVKINTNIRYAAEAEAVVQAVITSDSGQTAGRVKTEGAMEDAKLGPVGDKGRIVLTYYCNELYSYAEMAMDSTTAGNSTLVPLSFQLPWAPPDSPAAACSVRVNVRGPDGAVAFDHEKNIFAYRDLQQSLVCQTALPSSMKQAQVVLVSMPHEKDFNNEGGLMVWEFARNSLPPTPTMVLVWLSVPDASEGWESVGDPVATTPSPRATLLRPVAEDAALLEAALPARQYGSLIRCHVKAAAQPERGPKSVRIHTDVTISDASGSTSMRVSLPGGGPNTVRGQFSAVEEKRLFMRLQAVPQLRAANLLMPQDIWRQVFVIFDSAARAVFSITCSVGDLDDQTVQALLSALRADTPNAEVRAASELLSGLGKSDLLNEWRRLLENLRGIAPGGSTSFIVGADHARIACSNFALTDRAEGNLQGSEVSRTAYVNLDTDGGNNAGPCYEAIERLVTETEVVHGHVFGVGSWVDQDCASKVAKILMGATSLYLTFPQENAASTLDREDLSRWIKVLRMRPLALTVSAGAVEWDSRHGPRTENAADCLFATGDDSLQFDAPDISDATCTKAKLSGLQAGGVATLYLMSRLPFQDLAARLTVNLCSASTNALSVVGGVDGEDAFSPAVVTVEGESLTGIALGHHWLSLLAADSSSAMASRKPAAIASNTSTLCTRLRDRIEDDLSFAWELPTKSGSTAMVGRAKTDNRPPVPEAQQPKEPELMKKLEPRKKSVNYRTTDKGLSKGGGAVKGSSPKGAKGGKPCGAPPPPGSLSGGAKGKGGKSCGAPPAGKGPGKSCGPPGRGKGKRNVMAPLHAEEGSGLWGPADLLRSSRWMAVGVATVSMTRAVIALRLLASSRSNSSSKPATSIGVGGQEVWDDYACDSCKAFPIIGPRFKAGNLEGFDVCTTCRVAGRVGLSSNFGRIENMKHALRAALQAILDWLPLVLCGTSQKEGGRLQASLPLSSQLALMDTLDLRQALLTLLPDVPAQRTA
eukprot:TRINITY_DN6357_c0_g1_i4.p1 TRINITY_DN6357_c0_g1~~TRINITY_DN6357_c0_g1_i4.p1  ORF type:complete len:1164 (-),score=189.03 TRINITY_DN6357_c0_g1_i4:98-3550(-)